MKENICFFSVLIICMCLFLTGCTVNFNVNNGKENNVQNNVENELELLDGCEDIYYYNEKVQASYVDLGSKYYYVIYENDDTTDYSWTYETELTENDNYSGMIDVYNDEIVYIVDNGKLLALSIENADILWKIDDENLINPYFQVRENGIIDIVFDDNESQKFISVDSTGNILKKIDISEYKEDLENVYWFTEFDYDANVFSVIAASNDSFYNEMKININLDNYKVEVKKYEYQKITADMLIGKTLFSEYNDTLYFNSDGTITISQNGDVYDKYSIIRYNGTWNVDDGILKIKSTEVVVAYDGYYDEGENGERVLAGYEEKVVPADREEEKEAYYCADYDGKEYVFLDSMIYELVEPKG